MHLLYPEWFIVTFAELSIPFVAASFLLFPLYWHELMTVCSVIVHPFITKMRIPFFVISGFILLVQIFKAIARNLDLFKHTNIITGNLTMKYIHVFYSTNSCLLGVFYVVTFIFIAIYYTITGIKLLQRLHKSHKIGKAVNLRKVALDRLFKYEFVILTFTLPSGNH